MLKSYVYVMRIVVHLPIHKYVNLFYEILYKGIFSNNLEAVKVSQYCMYFLLQIYFPIFLRVSIMFHYHLFFAVSQRNQNKTLTRRCI